MTTIVEALASVMQDVQAVRKADRNEQQGFNFRGIDAVMNAVGPALRTHGVVVVPHVVTVEAATVEVGRNRTLMGHVRVVVEYIFHGPDGDTITSRAPGEAMDAGDKATAKAMSVAFRTCLLQALCLPTDEPDPDHAVYERSPAGITEEEFHAAQARFTAAGSLEDLKLAGEETGALDLSVEQRETLRVAYVDRKRAIEATMGQSS